MGLADKIGVQVRIRQFENRVETVLLLCIERDVTLIEKPEQQRVELTHPAAAAPAQLRELRRAAAGHQSWRSTMSFLIVAIARPGFRSFGQASVQFRIVWQR